MPSDTRSRSSSIVPYRDNIDTHFWPSNVAKRAAMIPTTSTADPNAAAAAGEAGTTPSTSSNATGSTNNVGDNAGASNQDTASLMASLQAFFGPQLTTIKNGMADQQRQIDALTRATNAIPRAAPTAPQPSMLERQREFERSWEERARAELRQGYSNIGMSASQINEALAASPLPRPVRHQATGGNQNQAQAPAAAQDTTPSTAPTRRHTFRPDDIGTFDGDPARLEFFLGRIGSLYYMRNDAFWREPLLETIPLCLKDTAAQWYQTASIEFRASLVTWPAWEAVLRGAFAMDINTARRLADERKWDPDSEDVGAYFYEKMARLRAAYPDRSESSLCVDIWIGLPEAFMVIVKLGDEPTPAGLLRDCRQMQNPFKGLGLSKSQGNKKGSTPKNNPQTTATASVNAAAATPLSTTTMVSTSGAAPSPSNSRPRVSLAESYDPNGVKMIKGERFYQLPGNGKLIKLGRNCNSCGEAHFDFEHTHLKKAGKQAEAHFIMTEDTYEGYPVYSPYINLAYDESSSDGTMLRSTSQSSYEDADDPTTRPRFTELGN